MRSVDTSVLVRAIFRDVPSQVEAARAVLATPVLVLSTVVLELFWVLRNIGKQSREEIVANISALMSAANIRFADAEAVRFALAAYRGGGDFPDMLHLALSKSSQAFVTFDKRIARHAGADSPVPVETLVA